MKKTMNYEKSAQPAAKSLRRVAAAMVAALTLFLSAVAAVPAHADLTGPGNPPPPPSNGH